MRRSTLVMITALAGMQVTCAVEPLPPRGEVVVHVDTDLPAPRIAGRLRIDLYDATGQWFASRDIARPNRSDWPVSFSVYADRPEAKRVWVRLRVYPQGKLREYRGERFQDWPDVLRAPTAETGTPRLMEGERDVTPSTEPEPLLTVDRLVRIDVPIEKKRHAVVVLRGACVGTMARLAHDPRAGPMDGEAASCRDTPMDRTEVGAETLYGAPFAGPSMRGRWMDERCEDAPLDNGAICVPGGALVLGNRNLLLSDIIDAAPERVIGVRRIRLDAQEVTVQQFRQALTEGFVAPVMPEANDAALSSGAGGYCTFSSADRGREGYALNCVPWQSARAYCQFRGGDLPTEAQFEHAATQAGHDGKVPYPWGTSEPPCDAVVYGRANLAGVAGSCAARGDGPVALGVDDGQDVSPLGLRGLAGGQAEWARDGGQRYDEPCWAGSVVDPYCAPGSGDDRSVRGGAWKSPVPALSGTFRIARPAAMGFDYVGFRCAYEEAR